MESDVVYGGSDPEPEDWPTLAPHHCARYLADDLKGIDRRVLAHLEAAGWVDVGNRLDGAKVPTVPTLAYQDVEFATMRCDYLLAYKAQASQARSHQVIRNDLIDAASGHRPVLATFEIEP